MFAIVECSNEIIQLNAPFEHIELERKQVGTIAVIIDMLLMAAFLLTIWILKYLVKVDSERHRNLLFETREFSVAITNLPTLGPDYSIEQMKAELLDHI